MVDIGRRIRELQKAKGLTQNDVENRSGLSRCHISLIENGHSTPLCRLPDYADCSSNIGTIRELAHFQRGIIRRSEALQKREQAVVRSVTTV